MSKKIKSTPLNFYITPQHNCPYLPEQQSKTLFLSPEVNNDQLVYSALINKGFRRSGEYVYRPHCDTCMACISVRVPVYDFLANKNQRRCYKKGQQFITQTEPATFNASHYQLFEQYINARHRDGDMYPTSENQYKEFLLSNWLQTEYLNFIDPQTKKLIACCVFDNINDGLSAIYTFFDPSYNKYSLGRLAVLKLIDLAKQRSLDYLYLGYWIKHCQKMSYKGEYRPIECFNQDSWTLLS